MIVSDFTTSPANPIAGDQVVFTATIQNVGQSATSNGVILGIGFYDSQNLLMASSNTYSTSLPAGGTVRLVTTNSWAALTGSQPVKAFVDDMNRIRESSENNNTLTKSVTVAPPTVSLPDLVITSVTHSPANPVEGDRVSFTATVKNNGTAATPAGTILAVAYKDSSGATIASSNTFTSSITAGASAMITTNTDWTAVPGTQSFLALADDGNRIPESDETNNTLGFSVTVSGLSPPPPTTTVDAMPAFKFVDSIGVNTHFAFPPYPYYTQYPQVKARLLEIGIKHIRDGSGTTVSLYKDGGGVNALFNDLGASGIKLNLIANLKWTGADIGDILTANQTSLESIEGQNEADVFVSGDWVTTDRDFQKLLWNTVKGSAFSSLPIYLPSVARSSRYATLGDLSAFGDDGNIHPYPGGNVPLTTFDTWMRDVVAMSGPLPVLVTETGYHTALKTTSSHLPISERGEAKYVPRMFLDYLGQGIARTYIYQFYDHIPPSKTDPEANFGLVRYDFSVRPSFTSLKNTMEVLNDTPGNIPGGGLTYSLSPSSTSIRSMLFQKTNGNFDLVLWQDVSVWNTSSRKDIVNADIPVTVTFAQNKTVRLYQPGISDTPQATFSGHSLTVDVPDEIIILEVF